MSSVKLVTVTPDGEKLMGYIARVSNPANQNNENVSGLLAYCIRHGHYSVFEHAHMTVEIKTTRAIAAQILRHRSFCFQEFSQRYAEVIDKPELPHLRRQDTKNRQSSIDDLAPGQVEHFNYRMNKLFDESMCLYQDMVADGVAKECARAVLPLATPTTIYMTGNVRSWIHYIGLRGGNGTQKEHMDIANEICELFFAAFPIVGEALTTK